MKQTFEEEVLTMLTPKIKSVLRQTTLQNQKDLEQELVLSILIKINKDKTSETPSFFELMKAEDFAYPVK